MSSLTQRKHLIEMLATCVEQGARQSKACEAINLSVRTLQRWQNDEIGDKRPLRVQTPVNRLSQTERQRILDVLNSEAFKDTPPSQIVPKLADQGEYIASESTFYRVMKAAGLMRHRHKARPAKARHKPDALKACAPNQLYSWDITYLPTPVRGVYFYLYLFMDVFSRQIVGWQVYPSENSALASDLMRDICQRNGIGKHQVVLHSDNGGPMKGASMLATLQALGVAPSFSRPAVSNDNPYSEALFKTLKYSPHYPQKAFADLNQARTWMTRFSNWYNNEHCHSGISYVTPAQRHAGLDKDLLRKRTAVYEQAKAKNPLRWSGQTRAWRFVEVVHLNPDKSVGALKAEVITNVKYAA